jgi:transposase-like protein
MTLADSVQAMRLRVIHRASVLGSVTAACQEAGISRTVFYRWRKRFETYGADGLHPRRAPGDLRAPARSAASIERLFVGLWATLQGPG